MESRYLLSEEEEPPGTCAVVLSSQAVGASDDVAPSFPSTRKLFLPSGVSTHSDKPLKSSILKIRSPQDHVADGARVSGSISDIEARTTGDSSSVYYSEVEEFLRWRFPGAGVRDWKSWRWQLKNRITGLSALEELIELSDDEREAIRSRGERLPLAVTPYYAQLIHRTDPTDPLRRTVVPSSHEFVMADGEADDPLAEDDDSPVPGIVHRYPDRVLLLATDFCSTNCRYCTRSRMINECGASKHTGHLDGAVEYIETHPQVRDVLISGGDPLTMSDVVIDSLLKRLRSIPHVQIVRIGTKVPAVLPQRITPRLAGILRRYHPLFVSVHFTHPVELTPEAVAACGRLADAGIPLGSQTVLLKGVNDDPETMRRLMHGLLRARVRPYYLYQCDPIPGSAHFRTPVSRGLEIISALRGYTSGYAVPTYVIDAPGGGGKIPLLPETVVGRDGDGLLIRNYEGRIFRYPDRSAEVGR
jgi:lysine 2,3-aminomutase